MMRNTVLAFLLIMAPALAQQPPTISPDQRSAARELVTATGLQQQVTAMLGATRGQLITVLRQASPRLTEAQVTQVVDEILMPEFQARSGDIVEMTEQLWASRLSVQELRDLTTFYATPLGQRLLQLLPEVSAQATQFGQAWGARVATEAIAKHRDTLRARGIIL